MTVDVYANPALPALERAAESVAYKFDDYVSFETWRPVPGAEGRYLVSSLGRIRSLRVRGRGRVLRATINGGYRGWTDWTKDGGWRRLNVHRVACIAFNGPAPFAGAVVRHLDGDKLNNLASNLAWGTVADNSADARAHGTIARGSRQGHAKLTEAQVREIYRRRRAGEPGKAIAKDFGVGTAAVYAIAKGRAWAHLSLEEGQ